jgi:hypothetical protein
MADWLDEIETETESPTTETGPRSYELLPEGRHEFKIMEIVKQGESLNVTLAHDDRRYGRVYARLQRVEWAKKIIRSLRVSLAIPEGRFGDAVASGDLAGRRVCARVYHNTKPDGRVFVNVGEFHAIGELAEESAALKASEPKPPAANKAKAVKRPPRATPAGDPDDIPF